MIGLPVLGIWIALVAFSLGVEIGHQVVVRPLFGLLSVSRQKISASRYSCLRFYGSVTVACCGAYYLFIASNRQFFSEDIYFFMISSIALPMASPTR